MEVVALLTAAVGLGTAVVGLVIKLHSDVAKIHVMVNSRMAEALARIDQLDEALAQAGVASPTKPSREERPDA